MIDIETGGHNQFLEWLASISRLGKRKDRLKEKKNLLEPNLIFVVHMHYTNIKRVTRCFKHHHIRLILVTDGPTTFFHNI